MAKKERIILKLSGAALKDKNSDPILSAAKLSSLAKQIKSLTQKYEIAIVVGGGNIWRGGTADTKLYREEQAHYMGMLATIINSLAIREVLIKHGVNSEVHSLLSCTGVAQNYNKNTVNNALSSGKVIILAGGTGKPFFSTDTGASKDATELKANWIVMGKDGVDGVYSDDPKRNKNAIRFTKLTFKEAINRKLKVMDLAALKMCQKNNISILVFNIERQDAVLKALNRKIPTTVITR